MRESIYQAQQAEFTADAVIAFLEAVSGAPLPRNVLRSLEEWGAHHARIVFRTGASLLQAIDARILERLLNNPAASGRLARSLTPTMALVNSGADNDLVQTLIASDLLPAIADPDPSHTDNDVTIHADGSITPVHAVPSIFLTRRLARLAEQDAHGRWRLTPASVQRCGRGRNAVLTLLAELERLHCGPLPTGLIDEVKQWGHYYGQATVATVILFEFESKMQLADVLAQPALQGSRRSCAS